MNTIKLHEATLKNIAGKLSIKIKEMEVLIELIKPHGIVSQDRFKTLYNEKPKSYKSFTYVQNNEKKGFLFLTDICEKTLNSELSKHLRQEGLLKDCSFLRRKIKLDKILLTGVLFSARNLPENFILDLKRNNYCFNNGSKILIQESKDSNSVINNLSTSNGAANQAKEVIRASKIIVQKFNKIKAADHKLDQLTAFEKEVLDYLSKYNNLEASVKEKYPQIGIKCGSIIKYIKNQKTKTTRKK